MPTDPAETPTEKNRRLARELTEEALRGPYVHEECGDTMWEVALAANEARLAAGKEEE